MLQTAFGQDTVRVVVDADTHGHLVHYIYKDYLADQLEAAGPFDAQPSGDSVDSDPWVSCLLRFGTWYQFCPGEEGGYFGGMFPEYSHGTWLPVETSKYRSWLWDCISNPNTLPPRSVSYFNNPNKG